MKKLFIKIIIGIFLFFPAIVSASDGLVEAFPLVHNDLELQRRAQPGQPFDKAGHKFAVLGEESGRFEAWAYPLKLFRNFEFSFFLETSTRPIHASEIVQSVTVTPEATVIRYVYQSFVLDAIFVTPVDESGAIIFLDLDSSVPLTIVCGFLPVLQPMWPAGIGGQYAHWRRDLNAYLISEPTRQNNGLVGSPFAGGISATPAHMLSDTPNEFKLEISDPAIVRGKYIPIYMTGAKAPRDMVIEQYQKLQENPSQYYQKNVEYYRQLKQNTLRVKTPDTRLNLAFEWAKVAYDNLMVENPSLGKGLVAGIHSSGTSGRPGFGWYFGGDAYMNMLSMNSYGYHSTVKDALAFTQKWQREDGKMAHELSQSEGYIDWWKDYPYGFIHADTTPFYIVAMADYYEMTGDLEFLKSSWPSLQRAYDWCLSTDANKDGLMDNQEAGLGASEYGNLTEIETDVYLGAVWVKATAVMQKMARAVGDQNRVNETLKDYQKALKALQKNFWYEEGGFYAYAFNKGGEHVREISPWLSVGLMWEFGTPEHSLESLEKLNSADLTTDWGVRLLSSKSQHYNPVGYNYGAIWPFVTGWVNTALFTHQQSLQGFQLLQANMQQTFTDQLGMMPEVLSGMLNTPLEESVSHQGFSSGGVVLPFVRGLCGLSGSEVEKHLEWAPQFPADWAEVTIENYRIGSRSFSMHYQRSDTLVHVVMAGERVTGFTFRFAPSFGIGTEITSVTLNGKDQSYKTKQFSQQIQVTVESLFDRDSMDIHIHLKSTVELLPITVTSETGDLNQGLKLISLKRSGNTLIGTVEGRAGMTYVIQITHPELIASAEGAGLRNNRLFIEIPNHEEEEFVQKQIKLQIK